jgi:hypothetical protein
LAIGSVDAKMEYRASHSPWGRHNLYALAEKSWQGQGLVEEKGGPKFALRAPHFYS